MVTGEPGEANVREQPRVEAEHRECREMRDVRQTGVSDGRVAEVQGGQPGHV